MKLFLSILLIGLIQGGSSFFYTKENRYAPFLKKYGDLAPPTHINGLNIKVQDETVDGVVEKLINQMEQGGETVERDMFEFEANDEFDGFDEIDLSSDNVVEEALPEEEDESTSISQEDEEDVEVQLKTSYGKWGCVYSKVFAISSNKTKTFVKVHETIKEGGKVNSNIKGSLKTKLTSNMKGSIGDGVNITVYHEGKEYRWKAHAETKVEGSETDKAVGKNEKRIISQASASLKSTITFMNHSMDATVTSKSASETFMAPFRIYLTLFGSEYSAGSKGHPAVLNGKIKGEITSRVVYAKGGKSLTKSTIRGYAVDESKGRCSVTLFKVKSHVWTKLASHEDEESDKITVDIGVVSKGKMYSRSGDSKKNQAFSGSAVASYEKGKISIPKGVPAHEHGVHVMMKHVLDGKLMEMNKLSMRNILFSKD